MLTLYGKLADDGDSWLFTPARRLDACAPDFGQSVRLNKSDVIVDSGYGLDGVRLSVELAKEVGLLPEQTSHHTMAAMYVP
jgi:hypothetical protein